MNRSIPCIKYSAVNRTITLSLLLALGGGCASVASTANTAATAASPATEQATTAAATAATTTEAASEAPGAILRSASFITRDLAASVRFYTEFMGYNVLRRSKIEEPKSRQVVGAQQEGEVNFVILSPADWSNEDPHYSGISFIEIPWAEASPFDQDATRPSRAGGLVLSHRVNNIREIERRMRAAGVPFVADMSASGSGRSTSMCVLDPNGIRVEMYEY